MVYAKDTAGNMGASETVSFIIVQEISSEPFPTTIVSTVSAASVVFVGAGLLAYFRKHKC